MTGFPVLIIVSSLYWRLRIFYYHDLNHEGQNEREKNWRFEN